MQGSIRCSSLVTVKDPSPFPHKIHFKIKNQVSCHFFPTNRCPFLVVLNFKSNPNVVHLLLDGVPPKMVTILFICFLGMFNVSWDLNAMLVSGFPDAALDSRDNDITLPQHTGDPSLKCWFIVNASGLCKLSHFNRV